METEYVIFQQELKKNIKKECHMISYDVREISTQMIKSTFYRKKLEVVETIYGKLWKTHTKTKTKFFLKQYMFNWKFVNCPYFSLFTHQILDLLSKLY